MPYTDMWEVCDANGTIHSGTEDEMRQAFEVMTIGSETFKEEYPEVDYEDLVEKYVTDWAGDIKLVQIHEQSC